MAGDAWFKQSPREWLLDTRDLTPEQRGVYVDLINLLHYHKGRLRDDLGDLRQIIGFRENRQLKKILDVLVAKEKIVIADGFITNPRVSRDLAKRRSTQDRPKIDSRSPSRHPSQEPPPNKFNDLRKVESESESEKKEDADASRVRATTWQEVYDWLERTLNHATPLNGQPIHAWLRAGADLELDIKPTVQRILAEGRRIASLRYFDQPILEAITERHRSLPDGGSHGPTTIDHPGSLEQFARRPRGQDRSHRQRPASFAAAIAAVIAAGRK
jgi:uncharacterized protein YdaU (DUF1376 family)